MPHEILQPSHLERPDLSDRLTWARLAPIHSEWLRVVAPQLDLDTGKIILGDALANIIGDDENSFGIPAVYLPEYTDFTKKSIFIRMNWECELPELPLVIRDQINKIRHTLNSLNWEGEENIRKARKIWIKSVKNFTHHQIALDKNLQIAQRYDLDVCHLWSPYWEEFLYGYRLFEK